MAEALKAALWNLNDYRGPRRRPVLRRLGRELGRMVSTVIQSTDPMEVFKELSGYWHEEGLGEMTILSEEP